MILTDQELSYAVIGLAMETHRELGPGLAEIFYHLALSQKLNEAGIPHENKPVGRLLHRGIQADEFEADVVIPQRLILELKTLRGAFAIEHFTQIICYLKFWAIRTGLLFDFGKERLVTKRVVYENPPIAPLLVPDLLRNTPGFVAQKEVLMAIW